MPITTLAFGIKQPGDSFESFTIKIPDVGASDIHIKILYSGVGHGDLHQSTNDWNTANYPIVPGHEIIGEVIAIGSDVAKFKIGDLAGVGVFIGSCGVCSYCQSGNENHCPKFVLTYNSKRPDGSTTCGGFAKDIVVKEKFAFRIPEGLRSNLAGAAPLLCGGITSWSPLRQHGISTGSKVGVIGLGGVGHLTVQMAVKLGAEVTVVSTSESKRQEALEQLGAHHFIVSKSSAEMEGSESSLDFILDTVAGPRDIEGYLRLLKPTGVMVELAVPKDFKLMINPRTLIRKSKGVRGSIAGNLKETEEMLEFCAKHQLTASVELIKMNEIEEAFHRMIKSQVRYRFVVDVANSEF